MVNFLSIVNETAAHGLMIIVQRLTPFIGSLLFSFLQTFILFCWFSSRHLVLIAEISVVDGRISGFIEIRFRIHKL